MHLQPILPPTPKSLAAAAADDPSATALLLPLPLLPQPQLPPTSSAKVWSSQALTLTVPAHACPSAVQPLFYTMNGPGALYGFTFGW